MIKNIGPCLHEESTHMDTIENVLWWQETKDMKNWSNKVLVLIESKHEEKDLNVDES